MKTSEEKYVIQGLNPDGEWVDIDRPVKKGEDPLKHRDSVIAQIRRHGVTRYSQVRALKIVTTKTQHGGTVDV